MTHAFPTLLAFIGSPGPMEMLIIGIVAILLFGNRLPSVMRSLGRGFVEFKRGLSGIEDEIERAVHDTPSTPSTSYTPAEETTQEASAPKFEPPPEEKPEKAEA